MEYRIHELLSLVQDDQVELASGAGTEAVRERVMAQVRPARRRPLRKLVLAAAAAAMLVVSACAAAYYTGGWQLFETEKALAAAVREKYADDVAVGVSVPGPEKERIETVPEHVARIMTETVFDEDELISLERGTAETVWTWKKVTREPEDYAGRSLRWEQYSGEAYAEAIGVEGVLNWDLSWVAEQYPATENGQLLSLAYGEADGRLARLEALISYSPDPEDAYPRLSIELGYDEAWTNDTEMILSSAYDFCEVHTTRDGVDVLIQGSGSRIWAEAKTLHTRVNLFTDCCTREEIIEVVEHLHLAALFGQMQ